MKPITPRQNEVLNAIANFWRQGRPPTTGELLGVLRLATESGLSDLLRPLEAKGYIHIIGGVRGRQRLIELTPQGRMQTWLGLPILGEIPAGPVSESIQECEEWIDGTEISLQTRPGDFGLWIKGDSMIGDGILWHDLVVLRPGIDWYPGQIVAAQIRDEERGIFYGTLKHCDLIDGGKTVRLSASNPAYEPLLFDAHVVSIAGVYKGLIRRVD
jgi:repressor LexA